MSAILTEIFDRWRKPQVQVTYVGESEARSGIASTIVRENKLGQLEVLQLVPTYLDRVRDWIDQQNDRLERNELRVLLIDLDDADSDTVSDFLTEISHNKIARPQVGIALAVNDGGKCTFEQFNVAARCDIFFIGNLDECLDFVASCTFSDEATLPVFGLPCPKQFSHMLRSPRHDFVVKWLQRRTLGENNETVAKAVDKVDFWQDSLKRIFWLKTASGFQADSKVAEMLTDVRPKLILDDPDDLIRGTSNELDSILHQFVSGEDVQGSF